MSNNKRPKSINALMKYMRDEKHIDINGSLQKRKLMNIGYYHGYKGYRFISNPKNKIEYSSFAELEAIYDFDAKLKALFYPHVMFIETALKNYVLESLIEKTNTENFIEIYKNALNNYEMFSTKVEKYNNDNKKKQENYKRALKNRLELRNKIYGIQSNAFKNGDIIAEHFLLRGEALPIWSIFELLSLGQFGYFVSCINYDIRKEISSKLQIPEHFDNNAVLPQRIIYAIKDLRNAIAHNDVIFDTRFKTGKIDKQIGNVIKSQTNIDDINFESITDYLVLIIYIKKLLGANKTDCRVIINDFSKIVEQLHSNVPANIFSKIIYTNNTKKIQALKKII